MNCALKTIIWVSVTSFLILSHTDPVTAKSEKDHATANNSSRNTNTYAEAFKWNEHRKLSWSDFRGPVNAETDESAAATHCGIGFRTAFNADGTQRVIVYNTFYTNRSWVRPDAKKPTILNHEQGHFDLCEVYTRKLRERMNNFDFSVPDVRTALMSIYDEVTGEYERRQQAYEQETTHGVNIPVQQQWTVAISNELALAK